VTSIF